MATDGRILLTSDLTDTSDDVARAAVRLAAETGARLTFFHVLTEERLTEARKDLPEDQAFVDVVVRNLDDSLERQVARVSAGEPAPQTDTRVVQGDTAQEILKALNQDAFAYVFVGVRNRSRIGKLILGSVTQEVLLRSPCPVVAVPV